MIHRVQRVLDENRLLDGRTKLLIGVSGGADSIFLMHIMQAVCADRGVTCIVGHVNHGLRNTESDDDAMFVRERAESLQLACHAVDKDTAARAERTSVSIEMAARADRHDAFRAMIAATGADALVLAHNRGDQAESVLLQLSRGSGPDGFAGMPVQHTIQGMTVWRPLLGFSRQEIRSWLQEQNIPWREDASNSEDRFLRNRMRAEILPLLEDRINPAAERHIAEAAGDLQDALAYLDETAESVLRDLLASDGQLHIPDAEMPSVIAYRILSKWLIRTGLPVARVSRNMLEEIHGLCQSTDGSRGLDLGEGFRVERAYQYLRLGCDEATALAAVSFTAPSLVELPEWGVKVDCQRSTGFLSDPNPGLGITPASISISATRLAGRPLQIRSRQVGDRMKPYGMSGTRKLQDIFTDFKIPVQQRGAIPVLTVDDEIVYLQGYRVADDWKVESMSHPAIRLTFTSL